VRPDEQLVAVAEASGWELIGPVRRSLWSALLPGRRASLAAVRSRR
jgi:hypothetical protein